MSSSFSVFEIAECHHKNREQQHQKEDDLTETRQCVSLADRGIGAPKFMGHKSLGTRWAEYAGQ